MTDSDHVHQSPLITRDKCYEIPCHTIALAFSRRPARRRPRHPVVTALLRLLWRLGLLRPAGGRP